MADSEYISHKTFDGNIFHHVGIACRSLNVERQGWESLGYTVEGEPFKDTLQGVSGLFMVGPGPRVELLEPLNGSDTLTPFLQAGIKIYHHAYETASLEVATATLCARRARVISPPKPAVAFGGRRVVFLMLPTTMIIEYIEMSPQGS